MKSFLFAQNATEQWHHIHQQIRRCTSRNEYDIYTTFQNFVFIQKNMGHKRRGLCNWICRNELFRISFLIAVEYYLY